jgi:molybdopterin synthase sulfur carrier subunit
VRFKYFAWVRERIGRMEEEIEVPPEVVTVGDLIDWLKRRGPEYELALAEPSVIRVALDRVHAERAKAIAGTREVALFPPMTGG